MQNLNTHTHTILLEPKTVITLEEIMTGKEHNGALAS